MGILVALVLYVSSLLVCSAVVYKIFNFLVKIRKRKPDFDPIDCRNQTRYLRYHYPEDKQN